MSQTTNQNATYRHLMPKIEDWPVAKFSKDRHNFISELNEFVFKNLLKSNSHSLNDLLSRSIYMEMQRTKNTPWKVDPPGERKYWKDLSIELEKSTEREDKEEVEVAILKKIINRYNEEIVGTFNPKHFRFSRIFLTSFFKRLFNTYFGGYWRWGTKNTLSQKIKIMGNLDLIRSLFDRGTVVVVPTHYSNLDSIMVGYAIDTNTGMPAFSYGAGLNLYNVEIVAYFMNRLGAFRVDRRKKNPIYLECLTSMSSLSLTRGVNSIFFPGGTRSRSGKTEEKVKLGLISSVVEAQRLLLDQKSEKKIFVVPLNLGYHFVLEASQLIDQHLQTIDREKFIKRPSQPISFKNVIRFLKAMFVTDSEVYASFGEPVDVFGNKVDESGISYDKFDKEVKVSDYFLSNGVITSNAQRESIYAKNLGEAIVQAYKTHNPILSSNIAAFTAFHLIYIRERENGLIHLINQNTTKFEIPLEEFYDAAKKVVDVLLEQKQHLTFSFEPWQEPKTIADLGIKKLGAYHFEKILKIKDNILICNNIQILYYYHNRLSNYDIEKQLGWEIV
ncbi:MAG: 1-acyl-sn-glycerol-3-phosphate acyltransferase [Saprospiraceae bacterium]